MNVRILLTLLLAPAVLLAALPVATAEPCIHFQRDIPLPRVATPGASTPGIDQPGKHVEFDVPKVGPVDPDPASVDIPGFTVDSVRIDPIVVYDGEDTDIEFEHCL